MLRSVLTNRHFTVDGGWYAPERHFENMKSVEHVEMWDTTSSSGDWQGYIVQRIGKTGYIIPFSQENRAWVGGGYSVDTGDVIYEFQGSLSQEELWDVIKDYESMFA